MCYLNKCMIIKAWDCNTVLAYRPVETRKARSLTG